jgi:hypothetical protein
VVPGVGISEEQELPSGSPITLEACPWLSVPSLRQFLPPNQLETGIRRGETFHDSTGVVGGSVVHDQEL